MPLKYTHSNYAGHAQRIKPLQTCLTPTIDKLLLNLYLSHKPIIMPNKLRDIRKVDTTSYPYIYEENVSIPLSNGGVVRCNVYRPRDTEKGAQYPVIVTYGPYGKDVPYAE